MFIVVTGKKGGISKTTTAVHLAAYFQGLGPTLLIDGDPNRSASTWARRGSMPFEVVDEREGAYRLRGFAHVVVDTEARPGDADMEALARGCDLLVLPTVPASLDTDVLILTLAAVRNLVPDKYRALPPPVARPMLVQRIGPPFRGGRRVAGEGRDAVRRLALLAGRARGGRGFCRVLSG